MGFPWLSRVFVHIKVTLRSNHIILQKLLMPWSEMKTLTWEHCEASDRQTAVPGSVRRGVRVPPSGSSMASTYVEHGRAYDPLSSDPKRVELPYTPPLNALFFYMMII